MDSFSRRRLLLLGGTGTALALAGCSSLNDRGGDGDGGDGETAATVAANVDDEANREIQQELEAERQRLQEELDAGEIDEEEAEAQLQEAQMEAQEAQLELITAAVAAVEAHVDDTEELAVVDSAPESGVLLVEGEATAIVELLDLTEVGALFPESQYEELVQGG